MSRLDPQSLPKHLDRLYRAAWALCGSPHDAEDLVQETCARVLTRPRQLHGQDELAYLMQALRNTFLTQRRTAARRPRTGTSTLEDIEPVDPRTGERPQEALQAREVLETIGGLGENYRLALVAVDVVGLSYREAADALGTREATIATRVFRARAQVSNALDERRGQPAPAATPAAAGAPPTASPAGAGIAPIASPAGAGIAPIASPAGAEIAPTASRAATGTASGAASHANHRHAGAGKVASPEGVLSGEVAHES